jgi:outer membrane protein, multidrug efflux system
MTNTHSERLGRSRTRSPRNRRLPRDTSRMYRCARQVVSRRWRILPVALLIPLLGGCFANTEKPDLGLEIPERYTQPAGGRVRPAADWWVGFRSRELTTLIQSAQADNLDIAVAIGRIMQAEAQARSANAALLPTLDFGSSATHARNAVIAGQPTLPEGNTYSTSLTASYTLDLWGKNRASLLAANETAAATRYDRDVVTLATEASVANSYFAVLGAQDRLRVAKDNLAASVHILELIRSKVEAGSASNLEVAQQTALVANLRATIPLLEISAKQNVVMLGVLLGRAPEHLGVRGSALKTVALPQIAPGLPSALLYQRPDIREAEAQLRSTNHSVESARAAFFPNITLTAQGGIQSAALGALFTPGALFYSAAASLTQPIFDGGTLQAQLEQQQGAQFSALQSYRRSVINAFSDVEKALISLNENRRRERLQLEAVGASRDAFEISEQRLQEGALDLVTLLNAQQTLFTAQDLLSQIRLARLLAIVSLYQALGGGWTP